MRLILAQPRLTPESLGAVRAPALILAGDQDLILDEHTLAIFHHLPQGELCIIPGATHMVHYDHPDLFNATVERFLNTPFTRRDRIKDLLTSLGSLMKELVEPGEATA